MMWRTDVLKLAVVAKLRMLMQLPAREVLLAEDEQGMVMVPHVSDVWNGRRLADCLPGQASWPDLAGRLTVPSDATDILVVDWLTDQTNRRGATMALLEDGRGYRLAPCDDSGAFTGTELGWAEWIRLPGAPRGLVPMLDPDRVNELMARAAEAADEFSDWLVDFGNDTDASYADWCDDIFAGRLDSMLLGEAM